MTTRKEEPDLTNEPWYETLRIILENYSPVYWISDAEQTFTTPQLIQAIEQHHGIPQGPVGKTLYSLVSTHDFVLAMRRLGYHEVNTGGLQLEWLMKKKVN